MCDFTGNLVAWMDGELGEAEAVSVARHVESCAGCRARVAGYRTVSNDFAAHYASLAARVADSPRRVPLWIPAVGAVAAAIVLVFFLMPGAVAPPPAMTQPVIVTPAIAKTVPEAVPIRTHVAAHRKAQPTNWAMAEPVISIAIPADAMFPPGAVPEGMTYMANMSLAGDGTIQQIRLQP